MTRGPYPYDEMTITIHLSRSGRNRHDEVTVSLTATPLCSIDFHDGTYGFARALEEITCAITDAVADEFTASNYLYGPSDEAAS